MREAGTRTLCRETKPRDTRAPGPAGQGGGAGPGRPEHRTGTDGPRPRPRSLDRQLEKTQSRESSVRKGTQSKGTGPVPKVKVTRGQRSLLSPADSPGGRALQGGAGAGGPFGPTTRRGPSSQALAARGGAGPVVRVQGAEPEVTALGGAPVCPQHPGVGGDLVQRGPLRGPQGQAPLDELLALCGEGGRVSKGPAPGSVTAAAPQAPTHTWGDPPAEEEAAPQNLLVLLEGDVPAHHVIEQHPQGPDGGRAPVVAVVADPLGRAVHAGACGTGGVRTPAPGDAGTKPPRSAPLAVSAAAPGEGACAQPCESSPWKNPAGRRGLRAGGGGGAGHMGAGSGFTTNRCEVRVGEGGGTAGSGGGRGGRRRGRAGSPGFPAHRNAGISAGTPAPQARTHAAPARMKGEPTQRRLRSPRGPGTPHADITTPTAPRPCAPTRPEGAVSSPPLTPPHPPPPPATNRTKPNQTGSGSPPGCLRVNVSEAAAQPSPAPPSPRTLPAVGTPGARPSALSSPSKSV